MQTPSLLTLLFQESHAKARESTAQIGHDESIQTPAWGGNSMHWTVGHIVVSRCNFLMLLGVPSIWDWSTCKLFIPGSIATGETDNHIDFAALLADLDRTQDQLVIALEQMTASDLNVVKDEQTVAEHLATYAAHESYHTGQLAIQRQWLGR